MSNITKLKSIIADAPFTLYQTHTYKGEILNEGLRGIQRRALINLDDIKGKDVMDLGCATGAECIWALEQGANLAVGIERGEKQVELFKKLAGAIEENLNRRLVILQQDLKQGVPLLTFEIDTLFCYSITHHLGYRAIWHDVPGVKTVYVEGGADSNYSQESLTDKIFTAELLGYVENNAQNSEKKRPLFRLTRK